MKSTQKSLEQVLVGALGKPDASAITREFYPVFRKDFGYLVKLG